jgi:hypothetical protein
MIDKGLQKVLTLFYFFVKKYKNIAWAPCEETSSAVFVKQAVTLK